jgi:hypothetical protein
MKYRTQNWIILTTGTVRKSPSKIFNSDCRGEGTMFSKCPSLPIDLNQNNTISREEFGSLRDEIADKSLECNPIYRQNGTLFSETTALHYRPITNKVTAF